MSGPALLVTPKQIDDAYSLRQEAFALYSEIEQERIELDATLKAKVAMAFADGVIEGSNPQKRDAAARKHFEDEYAKLAERESKADEVKAALTGHEIECKRLHALMRLMEIQNASLITGSGE